MSDHSYRGLSNKDIAILNQEDREGNGFVVDQGIDYLAAEARAALLDKARHNVPPSEPSDSLGCIVCHVIDNRTLRENYVGSLEREIKVITSSNNH